MNQEWDGETYCNECKHLVFDDRENHMEYRCLHPINLITKKTFLGPENDTKSNPELMNSRNDCIYWDRRLNILEKLWNIVLAFCLSK